MSIVPNAISSKFGMVALHVQKHSPTILFVGGTVGVVTAAVLASRATLKLDEVVEEAKVVLDNIKTISHDDYTDEDRVKDQALVYAHTSIKIARLYAPSVALGVASIGALAGSHRILTRRNLALTAAYSTLDKAFRKYRARVVEEFGEDKDREYQYGVETTKVTEVSADGKKKVLTKKAAQGPSQYARMFNNQNVNWVHIPEYNYMWIRGQQRYLNDKLRTHGHLVLNDVYSSLGYDHTPEGAVVGWLANPREGGDGYVSFGIFDDADALRVHEFMVGLEGELMLDFNVDGVIYDQIGRLR